MKTLPRPIDWATLALLVYEALSGLLSQYRANSIGIFEVVSVAALTYFVVRLTIRTPLRAAWIAGLLGICGAWLSCVGVRQFAVGSKHLATVNLTNFLAFRALFIHPISDWVSGENFTLLLLTLPFACATGAYIVWQIQPFTKAKAWLGLLAILPIVPVVAVLLLSLSRAVFWSILFFFIAACSLMVVYKVVTLRMGSLLLAGCGVALLLILVSEAGLYPGIFRAYSGRHVSQTRSTEGRLEVWSRSRQVIHDHPMWGVGSSNAALFLLSSADEDDTTGFTSRTFSLPIQILVEKGFIGLVCYSAFLLLVGWEFHRGMGLSPSPPAEHSSVSANTKRRASARNNSYTQKRLQGENAHRAMKCIFAAGLAAVLVRELTYSSLLEHAGILALALALAAFMCAPIQPDDLKIAPLTIAVAVVVLAFQRPFWNYHQADAKLEDFFSEVATAKFDRAKESIDEAIRLWPWNARYYGWRAYVESQQLPSQCLGIHGTGLSDHDRQAAMAAADDYRHSLQLNDRDAVAHHDLAWLEHLLGDNAAANHDWKESVVLDPGNAAFHVSYAMFLDESGLGDAAKMQYESAIELTPSILDSQFFTRYRARVPQAADSLVKEAISRLENNLGSGTNPILEARLGKLYLFEGDEAKAERALDDASKQLPNLPLVWFNLGQVRDYHGDSNQARTDFNRALTVDPSLSGTYLQLGQIDLRAGDKSEAAQYLEEAIRIWQRVNPVTSAHNNRLYDGPRQPIDDLLPTTLVWYISPCEASEAWLGLSQIYPRKAAYAQRSRTCEQLPSPHAGPS